MKKTAMGSLALLLGIAALPLPARGQGIVVDGAVVETKADGPCYPAATDANRNNRYFDCGNGTVLDTVTGLLWLRLANCLGFDIFNPGETGHRNWWDAIAFVETVGHGNCLLTDHSQPGDWRLPTFEEWQRTIAYAVSIDCLTSSFGRHPALTNDPGTACLIDGPTSFLIDTVEDGADAFWALDTADFAPGGAGIADLGAGTTTPNQSKSLGYLIWPVRPVDR